MLRQFVGRGAIVRPRVLPVAIALILLAATSAVAQKPAATDPSLARAAGWEALWGNHFAKADSLFTAAVKADGWGPASGVSATSSNAEGA